MTLSTREGKKASGSLRLVFIASLAGGGQQRPARLSRFPLPTSSFLTMKIICVFLWTLAQIDAFTVTTTTANHLNHQDPTRLIRLLLVDHYDSFTYNLVHELADFAHVDVVAANLVKRDINEDAEPPQIEANTSKPTSRRELFEKLDRNQYDGVILSPGPGNPQEYDLGRQIILKYTDIPILGICLGHQILGDVYGGSVVRAPEPVHGQVQSIQLEDNCILWKDIEYQEISVTRYHSLVVRPDILPECLEVTAFLKENGKDVIVMGLKHREYPHFGVQFHPESIGTPQGKKILENFSNFCSKRSSICKAIASPIDNLLRRHPKTASTPHMYHTFVRSLRSKISPQELVRSFSDYHYWIDIGKGIHLMGEGTMRRVEYYGEEKPNRGVYVYDQENRCTKLDTDILTYLDDAYRQRSSMTTILNDDGSISSSQDGDSLPFDFRGGHVGYFGYEVRHDTTHFLELEERGQISSGVNSNANASKSDPKIPTAAFIWAAQSYIFDERTKIWYLLALSTDDDFNATKWIREEAHRLTNLDGGKETCLVNCPQVPQIPHFDRLEFKPNRSHSTYSRNFDTCIEHIRNGDSYELCLTNQLEALTPNNCDPLLLYEILRERNPAPHSGYFNWNFAERDIGTKSALAICCSSPERFVSVKYVDDGSLQVEAKPIKGTMARVMPSNGQSLSNEEAKLDIKRAEMLQSSSKDRAENLMIVDLLRNDLSRACEAGSVHVARLMDIESFRSVHQMVSTIRGTLIHKNMIDVLRAAFPGGSMTGAPKLRTMELLHDLEENVCRGPYSGCLGYLSVNGCMDFNIIIRTAVVTPEKVTIGAGGAITILSQNQDEYEEMLLKASSVVESVQEWAFASRSGASGLSTTLPKLDSDEGSMR